MPPRVIPSSAGDAGAVALDGSAVIPSRPVVLPGVRALESVEAAPLCVVPARPFAMFAAVDEFASAGEVQLLSSSLVGDGPADALATRHVDPDGVPAAPLPFEPFAEKSSEAADGCVPQLVPRAHVRGHAGRRLRGRAGRGKGRVFRGPDACERAGERASRGRNRGRSDPGVGGSDARLARVGIRRRSRRRRFRHRSIRCGWLRCRSVHRYRRRRARPRRGGGPLRGRARAGRARARRRDRLARCDGGRAGTAAARRSGSADGRALRIGSNVRLSRNRRSVGESRPAPHVQRAITAMSSRSFLMT
jgi:hypothetical protein